MRLSFILGFVLELFIYKQQMCSFLVLSMMYTLRNFSSFITLGQKKHIINGTVMSNDQLIHPFVLENRRVNSAQLCCFSAGSKITKRATVLFFVFFHLWQLLPVWFIIDCFCIFLGCLSVKQIERDAKVLSVLCFFFPCGLPFN